MSDFSVNSIFGPTANDSALPQGSWNPSATEADPGQALAQGILGSVQKAINAAIGEKYADGQLVQQRTATAAPNSGMGLIGVALLVMVVYAVAKA